MKKKHVNLAFGLILAGACIIYGCSKKSSAPSQNANNGTNGASVSIQNFAFVPDTIRVQTGTTVTWTNTDGTPHTVTSLTNLFDSGNISSNATYKYTFGTAGVYGYHCTIHSMMKSAVVIVSGSSGSNGY